MRRVKEGTSAALLQSGLGDEWWADSTECYFYLRNNQDLLSDGKAPNERRFGMPFDGPVIPFGAMDEYHPISAKDQSRLHHQFGSKVSPGLFLGCALYAVRSWKGDILIADIGELEQKDASEIYARRLNAKEVLTPMKCEKFIFPVADGTVKISGGEQRLRTSTLTRERPEREEEQEILQGKSDELHSPTQLQEVNAGWWGSEKWVLDDHRRIHLSSSRCTKSQTVRAARTNISYSDEVHRRYHNNCTWLDVMLENNIEDYWNVDADRE